VYFRFSSTKFQHFSTKINNISTHFQQQINQISDSALHRHFSFKNTEQFVENGQFSTNCSLFHSENKIVGAAPNLKFC